MPSKKQKIDLMDFIGRNEQGELDWINPAQFQGEISPDNFAVRQELADIANGARSAARTLGSALIALLNQAQGQHGRKLKIVVGAPNVDAEAPVLTPLNAQEIFKQLTVNNDRLRSTLDEMARANQQLLSIQENLAARPTRTNLTAGLVKNEKNLKAAIERTNERILNRLAELTEAKTLEIKTTMTGKGVFWYDPISYTVCEGGARPAGDSWVRLVPAPESVQSPPYVADEARGTIADPADNLNFRGMPKDVNDRINQERARRRTALSEAQETHGVLAKFGTPTPPPADGINRVSISATMDERGLEGLKREYDRMFASLTKELNKVSAPVTDGAIHWLVTGMMDRAGSIAATLNMWQEALDTLGKQAAWECSEAGDLRKALGLGQ